MASIGNMNFFQVNECGLYKLKDNKTYGLELAETFNLLHSWRKAHHFADTIPWDPAARSSKSKCYCKDIAKDDGTGDFLVVLWKSDTDSTGGLLGAPEDETKGDVIKFGNQLRGQKIIWGRPCYYWVIPKHQSVISIRFDHSVCDSQLFQEYVAACITNRIKYTDKDVEHTPSGFARISYNEADMQYRFAYRFDISLRSLNTANSEFTKLAKKVTHIVKRETLKINLKDERAEWVKMFDKFLPYVSAKSDSKKRRIEFKVEAKPTVAEIKNLIEKYAKAERKASDWDNVGFLNDDGTTVWVDKYRLKDDITITDVNHEWFPAKFLLEKLMANRERYLRPIKKSLAETKFETQKVVQAK